MATTTLSRKIGNQTLTFESGKMARLADGAVMVTYGETQVLGTCVSSNPREGIDFFPLTIDVEERMYAVGKIPGSFFRREGRPSETAILTCRLIDRPLRPTFRDGFRDDDGCRLAQTVALVAAEGVPRGDGVDQSVGDRARLQIGAERVHRQLLHRLAHRGLGNVAARRTVDRVLDEQHCAALERMRKAARERVALVGRLVDDVQHRFPQKPTITSCCSMSCAISCALTTCTGTSSSASAMPRASSDSRSTKSFSTS